MARCRTFRRVTLLALLAAAAAWLARRRMTQVGVQVSPGETSTPTFAPFRQVDVEVSDSQTSTPTWREPGADGGCPAGYPVKVAASGIFHVPGGRSYDRTTPVRCYLDAASAEADGYRQAKA